MPPAREMRQRGTQQRGSQPAADPGNADAADIPNPLTLRAVSAVFRRRWAVPMTVAIICLVVHYTGILDDPDRPPTAAEGFDFSAKLSQPLLWGRYGLAGGAVFGSLLWVIVVGLSDPTEDRGQAEHWAQDNNLLLAVLLGLGMATGGICAFAAAAVWDLVSQGGIVQQPQTI
mmetsp:Transcript_53937/g.110028  ORF Transcript_53937/g.110028 Transcript_53937/m.110028 type:complete len:173 (-) Transcript_53937:98-616(-)